MTSPRIKLWTGVPAVLFGIAAICAPEIAAEADAPTALGGRIQDRGAAPAALPESRSVIIERRTLPQVAPGGTVVLRGSRSGNPNTAQPNLGETGEGYGTSNAPAGVLPPGAGGDRGLDRTGLSRRNDNSGLEPRGP